MISAMASAQIGLEIIERHRADLQRQAVDPEMKRERGTMPQDWIFALPEGVRSRQITSRLAMAEYHPFWEVE